MLLLSFLTSFLHAATPTLPVYVTDQDKKVYDGSLRFAAVGNICSSTLWGFGGPCSHSEEILQSIKSRNPEFVSFLGDSVCSGSSRHWSKFVNLYQTTLSEVPTLPVVGQNEYKGDLKLANWKSYFPDAGEDIGLNRTASWYRFDVESRGVTWRILVLDSNRPEMGSRWDEQMTFLQDNLKGDFTSLIVFVHDSAYDLGVGSKANKNASELLETIDFNIGFQQLRAVIFSGSNASQALLPQGSLGPLHLGVGGGGMKGTSLLRKKGDEEDSLHLLTSLDLYYLDTVDKLGLETAMDKALSKGKYTGKPSKFESKDISTFGWWEIELDGEFMGTRFFHYQEGDNLVEATKLGYDKSKGWQIVK